MTILSTFLVTTYVRVMAILGKVVVVASFRLSRLDMSIIQSKESCHFYGV